MIREDVSIFDVEVGNELFYYICQRDAEAVDGYLQLDDDLPDLGTKITDKHLKYFENIV